MKLLPLLCLLSPWFGPGSAQETSVVTVAEDAVALLPCSFGPEQAIYKFDWIKDKHMTDKRKEVFFYERDPDNNKKRTVQGEQFKGRVLFSEHDLEAGNASIKIIRTRLEDSGTYTCVLVEPNRKEFNIRLNVVGDLMPRPDIPGAARKPNIKQTLLEYSLWSLLCEVEGVPKLEVEWRNSAGQPASLWTEDINVTESQDVSGRCHVVIKVNVTTSDKYTCVATQRDISHQINNTLEVNTPDFVAVLEGDDAVLPCFLKSKENIKNMVFIWKKENKIIFRNRDRVQFNRLSYFDNELKSGNASIKIQKTQKSDSGRYTCNFPDIQKTYVNLIVIENKSHSVSHTGWIFGVVFVYLLYCSGAYSS